jgi:diaminohydroxyphosphoribosylaminopyrimidine deaminase / 5-amino-6-(5-phosphoribosylamino)uracil reductase
MTPEEIYMGRCLELAAMGLGNTAPNPMVGCVIVHGDRIIGEGFHRKYGEAHAEVNAIRSVKEKNLLEQSTLYVNLEPCSHYGKTPPCTGLVIENKIPRVVIGCPDSFEKVSGKGIMKLKESGCQVTTGILEKECRRINRRFFTFHEKKRPYIILKWAQTIDGYIAPPDPGANTQISGMESRMLSHKWRTEEQGIMVGTNTVLTDNPRLNVREWAGKNPVRIALDKNLRLFSVPGKGFHLSDHSQPTIIFTAEGRRPEINLEYAVIDFEKDIIGQVLSELFKRDIQSVIVEGGLQLIHSFIRSGSWDEARIFISEKTFSGGIKAPEMTGKLLSKIKSGNDDLLLFSNDQPL